jgi:hypothetical protein
VKASLIQRIKVVNIGVLQAGAPLASCAAQQFDAHMVLRTMEVKARSDASCCGRALG